MYRKERMLKDDLYESTFPKKIAKSSIHFQFSMKCYHNISNQVYMRYTCTSHHTICIQPKNVDIEFWMWTTCENWFVWHKISRFNIMTIIIHMPQMMIVIMVNHIQFELGYDDFPTELSFRFVFVMLVQLMVTEKKNWSSTP